MAEPKSQSVSGRKLEAFILNCNKLAMDHLHAEHQEEALSLLLKAEAQVRFIGPSPTQLKLKSITLNNLGCFYKRAAQPQLALEYLQAALDLDAATVTDRTNLAGTHLNICAIKSQIGAHESALQHALEALQLLNFSVPELTPNMVTTVVIAHHNAGVEFEYLQQTEQAVDVYRNGLEVAKTHLGPDHPLTVSLQRSYFSVLDHIQSHSRKRRQYRLVNNTPLPMKTPASPVPKANPRRSASKGAYEYQKPSSSPTCSNGPKLSRSFEEHDEYASGWMERRTLHDEDYREHGLKSVGKKQRIAPGILLQPLSFVAAVSKESRRDKSRSAPDAHGKAKPQSLGSPVQHKQKESAKTHNFRRDREVQKTQFQMNSIMKTLDEKLSRLESKVEKIPVPRKRKGRTLEVVNIVSEQIVAEKKGDELGKIVSALKVGIARKKMQELMTSRKVEGRKNAEKRAQAAIDALEQLKKQALEETTMNVSLVLVSKPKVPVRPDQPRRLVFARNTKSRPLDVIPEAQVESKSDFKRMQLLKLQAWVRMTRARTAFVRKKRAAVTIQKWVRMSQTRRLYLSIISAVQFIQAWWRLAITRRRVTHRR